MKAKRSKQYRKLMKQYCRIFNFREPYQVLVDADIVKDASRFKMDLVPALERTLHGKVKPMITQCSMRHLYSQQGTVPGMREVIGYAKENFERRRCGHHPDETDALSTLECMSSFITDSGKGSRNRYVVASQDEAVRRHMRGVRGVPLIYISRSVMIMEPMADASAAVVRKEERAKLRSGITSLAPAGSKRKRNDDDDEEDSEDSDDDSEDADGSPDDEDDRAGAGDPTKKRKKSYGPKGPNPLAAKKKKKPGPDQQQQRPRDKPKTQAQAQEDAAGAEGSEQPAKKKRKRRSKKTVGGGAAAESGTDGAAPGVEGPVEE